MDVESDVPVSMPPEEDVDTQATYSGQLVDVSIPKLLYHFVAAKATGRLTLSAQSVRKELFFYHGKIVAALSTIKRDLLGQHLLRNGLLTEQQLEEILAEGVARNHRMGDILIEKEI